MVGSSGPRGPYAKTAKVRDGILDAATEVFSEAGFHGTTMKEVAERAGISQRGLVHHFPSKDELLTEVLKHHEVQTARLVPSADDGERVIAGLLQVVRKNLGFPGLVELHAIITAEATWPSHPAHDHFQHRYADFRVYVRDTFVAIAERGGLTGSLSPTMVADVFIATIDGLQLQWLYDRTVDIEGTLIAFLHSVCPELVVRETEHVVD